MKTRAAKEHGSLFPATLLILALLVFLPIRAGSASGTSHEIGGVRLSFSDTGLLTSVARDSQTLTLHGLYTDVGVDGAFLFSTIGYQRFWDMATWDLAKIVPLNRQPEPWQLMGMEADEHSVTVTLLMNGMLLAQRYTVTPAGVACDVTVTSKMSTVCEIQGVNFLLGGIQVPQGTTFEFPGNVPYGVMQLDGLRTFATRQTAYCNPVVLTREGQKGFNALFLNEEEKWSTAVWRDKAGGMNIANLSMTETLLHPGESIQVGTLYLQLTGDDPYAPLQALYDEKGYVAASSVDGAATGPMYSCHPAGTMDSGFRDGKTMRRFADSLPALAKMGIENLWVLPIFEHAGRGVYSPTDQAVIDKRYGTDADVAYFVDTVHALHMKVLFDYVPHGPEPQDPWRRITPNGAPLQGVAGSRSNGIASALTWPTKSFRLIPGSL